MLKLRDYQSYGKQLLARAFKQGQMHVLLWLATGGGKTATFVDIAFSALKKGKKVFIIIRRSDLILQTASAFEKFTGHKPSIIMAQIKGFDPSNNIQIASIDTIWRRIEKPDYTFLLDFDLLIIDEAHDTAGETSDSKKYIQFLQRFKEKPWIGVTATPFNTGNKYLEMWDDIVKPIEPVELRDQGYLTPERTYAPKKIDVSGIKSRGGDFDQKSLAQRASESKIVGDIVETWEKFGENRPTILFAVNIEHSKIMAEAFRQGGIDAIHCDQSHNKDERQSAIQKLKKGTIKILCNVNIFSTGVDIPQASCGIFARPTQSEILYVQQVGRILRPYKRCARCNHDNGAERVCGRCGSDQFSYEKPDAIILDHANNCERFGLAYSKRYARLRRDTSKKSSKQSDVAQTKTCEECFAVYEANILECPMCEHINESTQRAIKHEKGELELIQENKLKYNKYLKIKNDLIKFSNPNWKPSAKWLKLYEKYGEEIFEHKSELEMPGWVRRQVNKLIAKEAQKNISRL